VDFKRCWSNKALLHNIMCLTKYFAKSSSQKLNCASWHFCLSKVSHIVYNFEQLIHDFKQCLAFETKLCILIAHTIDFFCCHHYDFSQLLVCHQCSTFINLRLWQCWRRFRIQSFVLQFHETAEQRTVMSRQELWKMRTGKNRQT